MVEWKFLLYIMEAIGFPREFIHIIKFLFIDTKTCVKINGSIFESFKIEREVR